MAEEHLKQLSAAREKLVADRRELAEALAKPFERGHTDSRDKFVAVQVAIEAIDRALLDEQPASRAWHYRSEPPEVSTVTGTIARAASR